ncbi:pitrilysin family protein [soil metagenome]
MTQKNCNSDKNVKEFELDNGLKIILHKNSNIPMVCINTIYHVGAKNDSEGKKGMAHLFEHLMFEGSKNVPHGYFDEILTGNGGESNAYTSWDVTSYYIVLPSSSLELGLWLESDRMNGFLITDEELEIQKDVITEEKMTIFDNAPYGTLEEESSKRLFSSSGYKDTIIGNMDHLRSVTLEEINEHFKKYYSPTNAVLSIGGDIEFDEAEALIRKYYSDIKNTGNGEKPLYKEDPIKFSEVNIEDNIQLPGRFIFYRTPQMGSKDFYSLKILSSLLTGGDSSILYKKLVVDNELVNEIDSYVHGMEDAGIFSINAIMLLDSDNEKTETIIDECIEEIKNGKISDRDIEKINNKIETQAELRKNNLISFTDRLGYYKTVYGSIDKVYSETDEFKKITPKDLKNAAIKYLDKDQRIILNYVSKTE